MDLESLVAPSDSPPRINAERALLALSGLFIFVNFLALTINREDGRFTNWLSFSVWVLCVVVGVRLLDRFLPQRDLLLFPLVMFLSGWGLVLINRLTTSFAERQTVWLALSVAALLTVAIFPHTLRWLRSYRYVLLALGLLLLISTIILGTNPSDPEGLTGAPQHWLGFSGFYFQPSEALKIILVAFLASYLGEHYPALRAEGLMEQQRRHLSLSPRIYGPVLLMWGLSIIILIWQRDLGTAVLFFVVFLTLLYVASGYLLILAAGALLVILAGAAGYRLFSVVELRIDIWLNPWLEAEGRAYQIVQSLQAFAAGGIFGQGVSQGIPTFIPVVHSDFVFAAVAEEWGLLGVITLLACIALLVMRGLRVATVQHTRPFYPLLATGLSMLIAIQSILIMGGVIKLLPLTGVTLPFLSYGGSSLLASFIITGLLLRLSAGETEL